MQLKTTLGLFLFFIVISCSDDDGSGNNSRLKENLLLDYSFKNNLNDSSGNNFHATNYGAKFTSDRFGKENRAIVFDGVDDYLEFPNNAELRPQFPISFSFWIRYDSEEVTDRDVFNTSFENDRNSGVYFNSQSSTGNYAVNFGDGSLNYLSSTRRTFVANSSIKTNVWKHIVIVLVSELEMKIYVDGDLKSGTTSGEGGGLQYSELPGCIGRHDRSISEEPNYFKGAIDSFKYWDRELEDEEVTELFNLDD